MNAAKLTRKRFNQQDEPTEIKRGSVTVKIYSGSRIVQGVRYPLFTLSYYDPDGRRIRKAFGDKTEAETEAALAAAKLSRGQSAVLTLSSTDREQYLQAIESLKPLNLSLSVAVDDFVAAKTKLPPGVSLLTAVEDYLKRHTLVQKSVKEVAAEMLQDRHAAGCSGVHMRDLEMRLNRFAQKFQGPISAVTTNQVREYLGNLKRRNGQPVATRTRRNFQTVLNSLFHFARTRHYVMRDVVDEICEIESPKVQIAEIGVFTPEQIKLILGASPSELLPALAIGAFCGLRKAELQRLDWRDVRLNQNVVIVGANKSKTASRRVVPIPHNCAKWIAPHSKKEGNVSPAPNDNALGDRFERTALRAGIKWVKNGLRHSFCSYRLAVTHDPARVATEAGNRPNMMHRHYKALVTEKEGKEWFSIVPPAKLGKTRGRAGRPNKQKNSTDGGRCPPSANSVLPTAAGLHAADFRPER